MLLRQLHKTQKWMDLLHVLRQPEQLDQLGQLSEVIPKP